MPAQIYVHPTAFLDGFQAVQARANFLGYTVWFRTARSGRQLCTWELPGYVSPLSKLVAACVEELKHNLRGLDPL